MSSMNAQDLSRFMSDGTAGAGNFLPRALAISRFPDEALVFPDSPYRSLSGREYRALSLAELDAVAEEFASFYHEHGVIPKDVIAVYLDDGIDFLIQYLALTRLGAIAAFVNGNLPASIAAPYMLRISASGAMVSADRRPKIMGLLGGENLANRVWNRDEAALASAPRPREFPFVHQDCDPVLITHSSGTTGFPKAVTAMHRAFFHGVRHRLANPQEGISRYFCALPFAHNSSVASVAEAIVRGCPLRVQGRKDARVMLEAIQEFEPHIVVAFPKQLVDMCRVGLDGYLVSSVQCWRSTGDAVHETHVRLLTAVGSTSRGDQTITGSTYIDGLGSSEMGSSLFYAQFDSSSRNHLRCVGKPQPWVTAAVLDEHSRELGANCVGRLGVKTPSLTSGYWNDSALTEKSRVNGYWITGDLVYRDAAGNYYHVDRITDAISTTEGPLYSLLAEEHILNGFPEVFDCSVYGVPDRDSHQQNAVLQVELVCGRQTTEYLLSLLDRANSYLRSQGMPSISRIVQDLRHATYVPEGVTGKVLKRKLREDDPPTAAASVRVA
jgi:long-chain acyl-CoA synthetase